MDLAGIREQAELLGGGFEVGSRAGRRSATVTRTMAAVTEPIRIVVADDHPMFRAGVVSSLAANPDFEVVGEGASADEAVALAEQLSPTCACSTSPCPAAASTRRATSPRHCPRRGS